MLLELLVTEESIGTYRGRGVALKRYFAKAEPPSCAGSVENIGTALELYYMKPSASVSLKAMVEEPPVTHN